MDQERRILTWDAGLKGEFTVAEGTECRMVSDSTLEGYALVFERDSLPLGGFVERIARDAVELETDVLATFNHSLDALLGRTSSGTVALDVDRTGLRYRVALPDTQAGRDVRELVRRGDVRGSSFTFQTVEDAWSKKDGTDLRTLKKIKVSEVGPVSLPAYPDTSAAVRALKSRAGRSGRGTSLESRGRLLDYVALRLKGTQQ